MLKKITTCFTIGLMSLSIAHADSNLEKALQKESQPKDVLSQFERDYVLLKKGQWEFENGFSWTYNSANQIFLESFAILDPVFLTVGAFGVENIRRYIFVDTVTLRYGLRNNLQAELSIPIIFRYDSYSKVGTPNGDTQEDTSDSNFGIGDISLGLSYQPVRETDTRPAIITSLSFKTKTGTSPFDIGPDGKPKELPLGSGYYAIKLGINMSKTIDPVVVFGGLSYAYNMEEDVNQEFKYIDDNGNEHSYGLQKVDPGDTISVIFGMVYAVSYKFSMGFQFQDDFTLHTYVWKYIDTGVVEKTRVANSNLNSAIFKFTTGWVLSKNSSLNINIGMGLTSDAPDFVLEIKYPIRF